MKQAQAAFWSHCGYSRLEQLSFRGVMISPARQTRPDLLSQDCALSPDALLFEGADVHPHYTLKMNLGYVTA